jgi:hypothetical protein
MFENVLLLYNRRISLERKTSGVWRGNGRMCPKKYVRKCITTLRFMVSIERKTSGAWRGNGRKKLDSNKYKGGH